MIRSSYVPRLAHYAPQPDAGDHRHTRWTIGGFWRAFYQTQSSHARLANPISSMSDTRRYIHTNCCCLLGKLVVITFFALLMLFVSCFFLFWRKFVTATLYVLWYFKKKIFLMWMCSVDPTMIHISYVSTIFNTAIHCLVQSRYQFFKCTWILSEFLSLLCRKVKLAFTTPSTTEPQNEAKVGRRLIRMTQNTCNHILGRGVGCAEKQNSWKSPKQRLDSEIITHLFFFSLSGNRGFSLPSYYF